VRSAEGLLARNNTAIAKGYIGFYDRLSRAESGKPAQAPVRRKASKTAPQAACAGCHCAGGQLSSWEITYLLTPVVGIYFYLYIFMNVYSRESSAYRSHSIVGVMAPPNRRHNGSTGSSA